MNDIVEQIITLKKEKDAVILAHYYVNDEVQAIADYVGDSFYLAKVSQEVKQNVICFCGVSFMGESAKLLSPNKIILLPDEQADCPMAHMADVDKILEVKKEYKDLAVVCYINSTAEIKQYADVCVTSSNAEHIVRNLEAEHIYFIPDENLGRYIASKVPQKHFIFNDGFCHVHKSITSDNVKLAKNKKPLAKILVHPECTLDVLEMADYIGSTSGIIEYATQSSSKEFIICTEMGVLYELNQKNPGKRFYSVGHRQFCPNMKRITIEKVERALRNLDYQVEVPEDKRIKASRPLNEMLRMAK